MKHPSTLTVITQQSDTKDRMSILGINSLKAHDQELLTLATRELPRADSCADVKQGILRFSLPMGSAFNLAQTLSSMLSARGVTVRIA